MLRRKTVMLPRKKRDANEVLDMNDYDGTTDLRSETHLMTEARILQAGHTRSTLVAAVQRLRSTLARLAGVPAVLDGRRLTVR